MYEQFSILPLKIGWVYPPVTHWAWSDGSKHPEGLTKGWLNDLGYEDFAGSGVVHVLGGTCALVGCFFIGPRLGRFGNSAQPHMPGHSVPLAGLGGFLLLFGFLAFNGGSQVPFLIIYSYSNLIGKQ